MAFNFRFTNSLSSSTLDLSCCECAATSAASSIACFSFKTLLAPLIGSSTSDPDAASRYRDSLRGRGGGGGGGGGGSGGGGGWFGGGGGGGGGDGGRRRPIGRLNNTSMSMPSCASGGCCG